MDLNFLLYVRYKIITSLEDMSRMITSTAVLDYGRPTSNAQKLGSIIHDLYEKKIGFS